MFKANTIKFGPCATEYKDRFWTQGRAVILGNTAQLNHEKNNKSFVADGRLRNQIENAERPFALFWLIPRSKEASACNLSQEMTEVSVTYNLKLPQVTESTTTNYGADALPQIPILYNPNEVKKNVMLVGPFDNELTELGDKNTKELIEKKAAEEKKRKADQSQADSSAGSKKAKTEA